MKTRLQKTRQKISPRTLLVGRGIKSPSPMTGLVSRRVEVSTSAMARQRIKTLWDFFNSFLSRANTRMVSVFPRIPKVERVQLVIWDVVSPPSIVYFDQWCEWRYCVWWRDDKRNVTVSLCSDVRSSYHEKKPTFRVSINGLPSKWRLTVITRDNLERRFSAQQSVATMLQH